MSRATTYILRAVLEDDPTVSRDIEIDRQQAVTGRVTDGAGKPVRGWVEYRPLAANANLKGKPLLAEPRWRQWAPGAQLDGDGRFILPVLPGPGVLLVRGDGDYLPVVRWKGKTYLLERNPALGSSK